MHAYEDLRLLAEERLERLARKRQQRLFQLLMALGHERASLMLPHFYRDKVTIYCPSSRGARFSFVIVRDCGSGQLCVCMCA